MLGGYQLSLLIDKLIVVVDVCVKEKCRSRKHVGQKLTLNSNRIKVQKVIVLLLFFSRLFRNVLINIIVNCSVFAIIVLPFMYDLCFSVITFTLIIMSTFSLFPVAGGRSRLHLIDLGSASKSKDPNNVALSLSALGNVIMALLNGQRHVPHRWVKLSLFVKLFRDNVIKRFYNVSLICSLNFIC